MPSLRKLRYRHNLFLPLVWPTKRDRELPVEKDFGKSASCHISVYRSYFLRYGFQQDNFQYFSLLVFSFLGSSRKSRIVCRRRSRSYSGGDISLTCLPSTPPTYRTKPKEKYRPACRNKPERQTSYLSSSVFVFYRWLLHARFITLFTIWLYGMQSDFYFFIRICLFSVYLHFDAVFTVSHPLVVPVQAQR